LATTIPSLISFERVPGLRQDGVCETASPGGAIYSARLRCPNQRTQQEWSESDLVIRPDDSLKTYQRCP